MNKLKKKNNNRTKPKRKKEMKRQSWVHVRFSSNPHPWKLHLMKPPVMWNHVLTSNFPDNHSFWRSLTYTDASTTSHTPHMHAQNGRKMTVIVFYRVTMDKVVGAPRITHLLTVTFGSRGCESDVKSRCQVSPAGTPEKDPRRVPVKLYCNGSAYDSKCVLPQALSSFVNVSVTQHILSSQEIFILFKSQLPIWYCQNVYNFVPKSFFFFFVLRVGKWLDFYT